MQVNSEEEWICYGVFCGPSSFRTQFLKDTLAMQPAHLLYLPEHRPPFTGGSHPRKRQQNCSVCSGCLAVLLGVFPTMEQAFPLLRCSDKALVQGISQAGTTSPNLSVSMAGSLNASLQFLISTQWSYMCALSFLHLSLFPKVCSGSKAYISCQVISS